MKRTQRILFVAIGTILLVAVGLKLMSIAAIASLSATRQTEHFVFYADESDRSLLQTLPGELERAHARIAVDLLHPLQQRVVLRVYPDVRCSNMANGNPLPWPQTGGNASPGLIETISPHAFQVQSVPPIAVELIRRCSARIIRLARRGRLPITAHAK